jgi:crotonobetainyl-CoA:carnitine CoA-transferase CaiB-like acyl-CoA transferase
MHWVGELDGPPLAGPGQLAWDEAGIHAAFGIVSALFGRDRFGGQLLDLSVHEVGVTKDYLLERYDRGRLGEWGRSVGVGIPPTGTWMCADGPFAISAFQQRHWPAFLAMLDNPETLSEPALEDQMVRREIFDGLQELIAELLAGRSRIELFEKGQAAGLPCAPVNSPGDFVVDPQPLARRAFASTPDEHGAAITIPWRWCHSSTEMLRLTRPAPGLAEHNSEIYLQELGFSDEHLREWIEDGLV